MRAACNGFYAYVSGFFNQYARECSMRASVSVVAVRHQRDQIQWGILILYSYSFLMFTLCAQHSATDERMEPEWNILAASKIMK